MRKFFGALLASSALFMMSNGAMADEYSDWVNKCVNEGDPGKNSAAVLKKWCECMTSAMDEKEKLSVLAWQNTPDGSKADKECDKVSGWQD